MNRVNRFLTCYFIIGSYQLLTDGHPSLVLDKCSDYWDGVGLRTMSGTVSICSMEESYLVLNRFMHIDGKED